MWRGLRAFVPLRDCEVACERSGSGVFIHSGGVLFLQRYFGDGSCMTVAFWCGAVFFSRFSVERKVTVGVRRLRLFKSVCWWMLRALLLLFLLVMFFFFLYVVFRDYLLVFSSSLSMKWAPSCADSFKKKSSLFHRSSTQVQVRQRD